jgi:hypothetical protein
MDRRGFLQAIFAAGVAPAFIKADNLMKLIVPSQELYEEKELITSGGNRLISANLIAKEALQILKNNLALSFEANRDWNNADLVNASAMRVRMPFNISR